MREQLSRIAIFSPMGILAVAVIILSVLLSYEYRARITLDQELAEQKEFTASTTQALGQSIQLIEQNLIAAQKSNQDLSQNVASEQALVTLLHQDLARVTGTVSDLDKLRTIDPELLAQYSKVYFLNEHYTPSTLATIPSVYTFDTNKTLQFHARVLPHLTAMLDAAQAAGAPILVKSAYRSFAEQASLKNAYTVVYGTGANKFSADQGYSEHQLGTTVDFTTPALKGSLTGFGSTDAFAWLKKNAYIYGFALSYPEHNTYYVYEPWHWRYVGVALASKLAAEGKYFYETDQRAIDGFLLNFFD